MKFKITNSRFKMRNANNFEYVILNLELIKYQLSHTWHSSQ